MVQTIKVANLTLNVQQYDIRMSVMKGSAVGYNTVIRKKNQFTCSRL